MFNEHKVAQMAAYLLHKRGGRMSHLKLMKLMYLADRLSFERYDESITEDRTVSLEYGPVLSTTLNLIGGYRQSLVNGWSSWISDKENNEVSLARGFERRDLGELSDADLEILDDVFAEHGKKSRWELVKFTHTLPEWVDPEEGSLPISTQDILQAIGKTPDQVSAIMDWMGERRRMQTLMASL